MTFSTFAFCPLIYILLTHLNLLIWAFPFLLCVWLVVFCVNPDSQCVCIYVTMHGVGRFPSNEKFVLQCAFAATVAAMYYSYYMLPDGTYCLAPPPPGIDVAAYYGALPPGVSVSGTAGVAAVPPPPGTTPPPPPDPADSAAALAPSAPAPRYLDRSFLHFNTECLARVLLLNPAENKHLCVLCLGIFVGFVFVCLGFCLYCVWLVGFGWVFWVLFVLWGFFGLVWFFCVKARVWKTFVLFLKNIYLWCFQHNCSSGCHYTSTSRYPACHWQASWVCC